MSKYVVRNGADFQGFMNDTGAYLNGLEMRVRAALKETMGEVTTDLLHKALANAPEDTGQMRNEAYAAVDGNVIAGGSVMAKGGPILGGVTGEVGFPSTSAQGFPYPTVQDNETGFFRDAVEANSARYMDMLAAAAKRAAGAGGGKG